MNKKFYIGMIIIMAIILLDLFIKRWLINNFEIGEIAVSIKNFLIVSRVETHTMSYGFRPQVDYFFIIEIGFQLIFLLFFITILIRKINMQFILFSIMIIGGWAGNYFDKLFFSNTSSYQHLDYLNFNVVSSAFINLSSLMSMLGWILLIFTVIFKYKDFRKVFVKAKTDAISV